jgi:phage baseplate assembly protein V
VSSVITIPKIVVETDGGLLPTDDARALGEVRVHQFLSLPTVCELTFYEPNGPLVGGAALLPGASLRITVEGFREPLFVGQVTAVDHEYGPSRERLVHVRGYDVLHRLQKRQPVGAHVQLNLNELAQTMVADLGLTVEAVNPGPLRQNLVQYNQSDLALMTDVAERCGLYFTLRDPVLHFITLEGFGAEVSLALASTLLEARIEVNTDASCRSVETTAWDPHRVEQFSGRADRARVGRQVAVHVPPDRVGSTGQRTIVDELVQDDYQAEGIAQAELDHRVARAGRYVLTAVRHIIDHIKGFICEMDTAPPKLRMRPRATFTTWGVVSQVDDPDNMGRVRVVLPNYGDVETGWLQVVVPGAGPNKGIIALPDVNDQVLVLLINEDPDQAVVLGGLYGVNGPPDSGVEDGAVRRYTLTTPGGQRVRLNDEQETIHVENSNGDFIQLSPEEVRIGDHEGSIIEFTPGKCLIHAKADLTIEAPGKKVTISGQAINFERA